MSLTLEELGWTRDLAGAVGESEDPGTGKPARLMALHRSHAEFVSDQFVHSVPASLLPLGMPLAVGDWVIMDDAMHVCSLVPRKSLFRRRAPGTARQWQLMAANVDVLFIVSSCNQDFNIARLERYLVLARDSGVWPIVVLTKTDLCDDMDHYRRAAENMRSGLTVEPVNALDEASARKLLAWCNPGQTVALVGSSGVGKSTLINTLLGNASIETDRVREQDAKGRHTTTTRSMHRLPNGSWLLDTPGLRELQLAEVQDGIERVYDDIARLATRCRFNDCSHDQEPGCAVQAAIEEGKLDSRRLGRYRKLLQEDARNTETLAERHSRERQFGRMVREIVADRKRRTRL